MGIRTPGQRAAQVRRQPSGTRSATCPCGQVAQAGPERAALARALLHRCATAGRPAPAAAGERCAAVLLHELADPHGLSFSMKVSSAIWPASIMSVPAPTPPWCGVGDGRGTASMSVNAASEARTARPSSDQVAAGHQTVDDVGACRLGADARGISQLLFRSGSVTKRRTVFMALTRLALGVGLGRQRLQAPRDPPRPTGQDRPAHNSDSGTWPRCASIAIIGIPARRRQHLSASRPAICLPATSD